MTRTEFKQWASSTISETARLGVLNAYNKDTPRSSLCGPLKSHDVPMWLDVRAMRKLVSIGLLSRTGRGGSTRYRFRPFDAEVGEVPVLGCDTCQSVDNCSLVAISGRVKAGCNLWLAPDPTPTPPEKRCGTCGRVGVDDECRYEHCDAVDQAVLASSPPCDSWTPRQPDTGSEEKRAHIEDVPTVGTVRLPDGLLERAYGTAMLLEQTVDGFVAEVLTTELDRLQQHLRQAMGDE